MACSAAPPQKRENNVINRSSTGTCGIGASNVSVERFEASWKVSQERGYPSYATLQPLYNLSDRATYKQTYEPLSQRYDLGVLPYFALASGFLSGKYRSEADLEKSPRRMFVQKYLNERGSRILTALDEIARQYHATPTQVALAWLLARPSVTAPIVSATSVEQLQDLLKSTEMKLDGAALQRLNQASAYE
jgi:aryl-alcohol dehydrogenase-like predicted oxidoreductase